MVRKQLSMERKAHALALLEQRMPVTRVAKEVEVCRQTIHRLLSAAPVLPPGATPPRKKGSGGPKKTSLRTDKMSEVMSNPFIAATTLKSKHPDLLRNVSVRTLRHRLQKDMGLPTRRAAKKPLFTDRMRKKHVAFCRKFKHWTPEAWKKVMFSDESTFKLVRGVSKTVRCPIGSSRFDPKYTVKAVKHPESVKVLGRYSGVMGRGGLYFLPKNITMKGRNYIEKLKEHFLPFWKIHGCDYFMHDGAPSKQVKSFLQHHGINVLKWPGNSPDLNPTENAWHIMKHKVQEE
uniref:Uncharacterized protein n=1 Tax=Scylla olivacea TaxID=85551 RepID=A0A0P4WG26_SCYOL